MMGWCPYDGEECHHDGYCYDCLHNKKEGETKMNRLEELKIVELGEKIGYKKGFEDAKKQFERPHGEWKDFTDDGYVECPFCGSATNCDGNIDDLHYCFSCGADMRKEGEEE